MEGCMEDDCWRHLLAQYPLYHYLVHFRSEDSYNVNVE